MSIIKLYTCSNNIIEDMRKDLDSLINEVPENEDLQKKLKYIQGRLLMPMFMSFQNEKYNAYIYFCEMMEFLASNNVFNSILIKLPKDIKYYRARRTCGEVYTEEQMFHVPFNIRKVIGNQRYNYGGCPCLYLGSSKEVVQVEMNALHKLQIASYTVNENLDEEYYIFDLVSCFNDTMQNNLADEARALMLPLIIASSMVCSDLEDNSYYRPDYFIPQMLLEYVMHKAKAIEAEYPFSKIIGIRYITVQNYEIANWLKNKNTTIDVSKWSNYVFPAFCYRYNYPGHSEQLRQLFNYEESIFL